VKRIVLPGLATAALMTSSIAAAITPASAKTTEAGACTDCYVRTESGLRMKDNMNFITDIIDQINSKFKWANSCEKFSTENSLGQWGKAIRSDFMTSDYEYLEKGPRDIMRICPTYTKMKKADKANFWVLVFNAMAHYESSCDASATAKGPNGSLKGLLQLHVGAEGKYAKSCENGDSKTPTDTFNCAFNMLNDQVRRDEDLFSRKSYWDVLRPQAASRKALKITAAIKAYVPCTDETKLNVKQAEAEMDQEIFNALTNEKLPDENPGLFDI
jgi:hypothetical protein